jgi:hypothetical protein
MRCIATGSGCGLLDTRAIEHSSADGTKGSFSLLVDVRNGLVAVVGKPFPTRAGIGVDKNLPLECRPCVIAFFPSKTGKTSFASLNPVLSFF